MISSYELPVIVERELPELGQVHHSLRPILQVFAVINDFTDLTGKAIATHHYLLAGRCFKLADKCYRNGDRIIRSLIKKSYIAGFGGFMPADAEERIFVKSLMPSSIIDLYEDQLKEEPE